jgi:hypothetical protein
MEHLPCELFHAFRIGRLLPFVIFLHVAMVELHELFVKYLQISIFLE